MKFNINSYFKFIELMIFNIGERKYCWTVTSLSFFPMNNFFFRKLGKSTLVLVPLFGVPYFVFWGLSTSTNAYVEITWLFLDQVFASFQVRSYLIRQDPFLYTLTFSIIFNNFILQIFLILTSYYSYEMKNVKFKIILILNLQKR